MYDATAPRGEHMSTAAKQPPPTTTTANNNDDDVEKKLRCEHCSSFNTALHFFFLVVLVRGELRGAKEGLSGNPGQAQGARLGPRLQGTLKTITSKYTTRFIRMKRTKYSVYDSIENEGRSGKALY